MGLADLGIDAAMLALNNKLQLAAGPAATGRLTQPQLAFASCVALGALSPGRATPANARTARTAPAARQRLLSRGRQGRVPKPAGVGGPVRLRRQVRLALLRLAYQGLEIVRDGRLILPMPERERVLRACKSWPTCSTRSTPCSGNRSPAGGRAYAATGRALTGPGHPRGRSTRTATLVLGANRATSGRSAHSIKRTRTACSSVDVTHARSFADRA